MSGLLVGLTFGSGLLLVLAGWRATAPPPPLLAALQRVPGYEPPGEERTWFQAALQPVLERLAVLLGGREELARRLRRAGDTGGVDRFLMMQSARAGALAALALALLLATGNAGRAGASVLLVLLAAVGGVLLGDHLLSRRAARRSELMAEQFPLAAQLLALLLAAGAQPTDAIAQVGRRIGGPLGELCSQAALRVGAGARFATAMRELAGDAGSPAIERFVSALLAGIERGSPLSELMRAQAMDAAADSHRQLMEAAGRRDIAMLVPVVFGVLPCVVVVVLLPGAVQLGLV